METGCQRVQIIKAHLSDGDAKLAGLVFPYFTGHDFPAWEAVKAQAYNVVYCAKFMRVMVQLHVHLFLWFVFWLVSSVQGKPALADALRRFDFYSAMKKRFFVTSPHAGHLTVSTSLERGPDDRSSNHILSPHLQ